MTIFCKTIPPFSQVRDLLDQSMVVFVALSMEEEVQALPYWLKVNVDIERSKDASDSTSSLSLVLPPAIRLEALCMLPTSRRCLLG